MNFLSLLLVFLLSCAYGKEELAIFPGDEFKETEHFKQFVAAHYSIVKSSPKSYSFYYLRNEDGLLFYQHDIYLLYFSQFQQQLQDTIQLAQTIEDRYLRRDYNYHSLKRKKIDWNNGFFLNKEIPIEQLVGKYPNFQFVHLGSIFGNHEIVYFAKKTPLDLQLSISSYVKLEDDFTFPLQQGYGQVKTAELLPLAQNFLTHQKIYQDFKPKDTPYYILAQFYLFVGDTKGAKKAVSMLVDMHQFASNEYKEMLKEYLTHAKLSDETIHKYRPLYKCLLASGLLNSALYSTLRGLFIGVQGPQDFNYVLASTVLKNTCECTPEKLLQWESLPSNSTLFFVDFYKILPGFQRVILEKLNNCDELKRLAIEDDSLSLCLLDFLSSILEKRSNIRELWITIPNNQHKYLWIPIFERLIHLRTLKLYFSPITHCFVFPFMSKINELDINWGKKVHDFNLEDLVKAFPGLRKLSLPNLNINRCSFAPLKNLSKLVRLECSDSLGMPHPSLYNLTQLKELNLMHNGDIIHLPSEVENLQMLESLAVGACTNLQEIQFDANTMPRLRQCHIHSTKLDIKIMKQIHPVFTE